MCQYRLVNHLFTFAEMSFLSIFNVPYTLINAFFHPLNRLIYL